MTDQAPELLPCPFCESAGEIVKNAFPPRNRWRHPSCSNPNCVAHVTEQDEQGGTLVDFRTDAEAIKLWNTRPTPAERPSVKCETCGGEGFINRHANLPDDPCPTCNPNAPSAAERLRAAAGGPAERPVPQVREAAEALIYAVEQTHDHTQWFEAISKLKAALTARPSDAAVALKKRLLHAITTAQNDDYSKPMTTERDRHVIRQDTMRDVVEFLGALAIPHEEAVRALAQKIEAEARRYAEMYSPHSDGRNTFVIFADWIAALQPSKE